MSASVDEEEIKRFSERASVWWDPNGVIAILHKQCPQIRIPLITNGLKKLGKTLEGEENCCCEFLRVKIYFYIIKFQPWVELLFAPNFEI